VSLPAPFDRQISVADLLAVMPEPVRQRFERPLARPPLSLDKLAPRPPKLDPALLPRALRDWLVDEATRLGVPLAAAAGPALVAAGATIGSTAHIQVMQYNSGWTEPGTLWGANVGTSGVRKTPTLNASLKHIRAIDRAKQAAFAAGSHTRSADAMLLDRQIKAIELGVRKGAAGAPERAKLATLIKERRELAMEPPRLEVNDVTMERLATLGASNPRGTLLIRDELAGLLGTMQRDGHEGDRAFLLEAYNANASHTFDRMSRESTVVYPLAISIYGLIQPSVLEAHIRLLDRTAGGDGFFARFQIITLMDATHVGDAQDRYVDAAAETQAFATFRTLDEQALATIDGQPRGYHQLVRFDPDAQAHFDLWRKNLEARARDLGESALAAYLSKSPAAGARLALVVHQLDRAAGSPATAVTLEQAVQATGLMDHFAAHAELLYGKQLHPHAILARDIADKIRDGRVPDGASVSDVGNLFDARARGSMRDVREALDLLARLDWLRVEERQNRRAPPTYVIHLNPTLTVTSWKYEPLRS
jgi:hypothetical protein